MKLPNFGENPSYDCWLSYRTIKNAEVLKEYTEAFSGISVLEESLVFKTALNELKFGLEKILGKAPADTADSDGGIVLGFCENIKSLPEELASGVEKEGYIVRYRDGKTIIAGKTDRGFYTEFSRF